MAMCFKSSKQIDNSNLDMLLDSLSKETGACLLPDKIEITTYEDTERKYITVTKKTGMSDTAHSRPYLCKGCGTELHGFVCMKCGTEHWERGR